MYYALRPPDEKSPGPLRCRIYCSSGDLPFAYSSDRKEGEAVGGGDRGVRGKREGSVT